MTKKTEIITTIDPVERILDSLLIFVLGTDGGIGKSTGMNAISDYYDEEGIPIARIDCDVEKTKKGSFSSFHENILKTDIRDQRGADALIDAVLDSPSKIAIADLAANLERHSLDWFDSMHASATKAGIRFLVVGVVTNSSGSVEAVIRQARIIKKRARYLIIKNEREWRDKRDQDYFGYFENSPQGNAFVELAQPAIVHMEYHTAEIQNELDNRGLTLYQALNAPQGKDLGSILSRGSTRIRMDGYHTRFRAQLKAISHEFKP